MSANADQPQRSSVGVRQWRERTLVSAGFDDAVAARLAGEPEVDLHALLELVDRGCPPHLASRIFAPLSATAR